MAHTYQYLTREHLAQIKQLESADDLLNYMNTLEPDVRLELYAAFLDIQQKEAEKGYPDKERGLWGDKHPCGMCGKFGVTMASGGHNLPLCLEHKEWWDTEAKRIGKFDEGDD